MSCTSAELVLLVLSDLTLLFIYSNTLLKHASFWSSCGGDARKTYHRRGSKVGHHAVEEHPRSTLAAKGLGMLSLNKLAPKGQSHVTVVTEWCQT